jgi:hypothetical protein
MESCIESSARPDYPVRRLIRQAREPTEYDRLPYAVSLGALTVSYAVSPSPG